ncbi:MAG: UDP-3-O-(3-hydroxymyristoyl)glucosamine N-acyltransferase [Pseudomonadota bacterium]|nr:UDP-3-O-(3-hydroxymyristoyl)glucosamine N-acyltransferase [Pseudomonadota bacterium]
MMGSVTLGELAQHLRAELNDAGQRVTDLPITGLATLATATSGQLSFLSNPKYIKQLAKSDASAFIVHPDMLELVSKPCLVTRKPYVAYAHASQLFDSMEAQESRADNDGFGIDASARVSPQAVIGERVVIGPGAVIDADVVIGDGTRIGANVSIGRGSRLGSDCVIHANVSIYHRVRIGSRVILHSSVVIGADGFGFAFDGERSVKIAQLGSVTLGDDVEVGAGSTIDRGALDDTVIGNGVKIDNQVQIGHNCTVGDHTVICGCTALAGSTHIGRYCLIGGGVGITGHLTIADKVSIGAMSMVSRSVDKPGVYASGAILQESSQWRRNAVAQTKLADLSKALRIIEKQLGKRQL